MDRAELDILIAKYVDGDCLQAEAETLLRELDRSAEARTLLAQCLYHEDSLAEALSNGAKSRDVSKRLTAVLRRRRFTYWAIAASAACAMLAALAYFFLQNNRAGSGTGVATDAIATVESIELKELNGAKAPVLDEAGGTHALSAAQHLLDGVRLNTGDAAVRLAFSADATRLDLKPNTVVTLQRNSGGRIVTMERGELTADVAKQVPGTALRFVTPQASAEVVGTRLRIQTDLAHTELAVSEGAVRFSNHAGESFLVRAGERRQFTGNAAASDGAAGGVLAFFDFETPPENNRFRGTRVPVPAAPGNGSQFCMKSWLDTEYKVEAVDWDDTKPIISYADNLELEFDLFLEQGHTQLLDVCIYNVRHEAVFLCDIEKPRARTWTHIRLPLRDFHSDDADRHRISKREEFTSLRIQCAVAEGQFLLIDNLKLSAR